MVYGRTSVFPTALVAPTHFYNSFTTKLHEFSHLIGFQLARDEVGTPSRTALAFLLFVIGF